jgi:ribosome-interacting GTPase 1
MEFKEDIREWVNQQREISRVHCEMAPLEKKIRKLKAKSASLEAKIVDFMNKNNMGGNRIEVGGDANIFMKDVGRIESISRDFLLKKATAYFKDEATAKRFVDFIYNSRENKTTKRLVMSPAKPA